MKPKDFNTEYHPTWCPGCGDWAIWGALKESLVKLGWSPDELALIYGIGCSGNMNDFVRSYGFHALHGRGIANAVGLRLANHQLPVICILGDGDCYGEGGNHLIHACRGNFNLTAIVHDNRVYGLTTGQASPTADKGYRSKSTPAGIIEVPVNPLTLAITQGATFVSQGFAGDIPHLTDLLVKAIKHQGFSLVNVLQPCITFNKLNTYQWFREKIYKLKKKPKDKMAALKVAGQKEKLPLGILFQESRPTYEESLPQLKPGPLVKQPLQVNLNPLLKEFE